MSRPHLTPMRTILPIMVGWLALPAVAAQLDTVELARCVAIPSNNERLACLDAFAATALRGAASVPPATTSAVAPSTQTVPAAPAAAIQPTPAAHAINPDDPVNFGLTRQQLKVIPGGPESIKSVVSQMTQDRLNNVIVLLDNGQTWTFVEQEPRLRPGDSVTIKRAALGSFLMLTPSRHSYRVERSK